jgi:hypothetical protein
MLVERIITRSFGKNSINSWSGFSMKLPAAAGEEWWTRPRFWNGTLLDERA